MASNQRVITVTVAADDIAAWGRSATVTVRWAAGDSFTGRSAIDSHTGTSADVELVTQKAELAITVPVTALHDGREGGIATQRSIAGRLVTQGWAQATFGLQAGERVPLPGFSTAESDDT